MKRDCRGATLIWLMFIVLLFLLLGGTLISLAYSDWRVSRHLWAATQARYAAEAGIELALSALGPVYLQLDTEWSYLHTGEPEFTVRALRLDERTLKIKATGMAGGITETMEVLASWRPLGRQGIRGRKVTLNGVTVHGHVLCEQITFNAERSRVYGTYLHGTFTAAGRRFWPPLSGRNAVQISSKFSAPGRAGSAVKAGK